MFNADFKDFLIRLDAGLAEAEDVMLRDKASRGESCVYADKAGRIYRVPAKDVLAQRQRPL